MFSWLGLIILYIHLGNLLGALTPIASVTGLYEPKSLLVAFVLSPLSLSRNFSTATVSTAVLSAVTLVADYWVITQCIRDRRMNPQFKVIERAIGFVTLLAWIVLAVVVGINPFWGRHTVVMVATPLLCVAADTYMSSRELAVAGLEKLGQFKYSYKKA